MNNRFRGSVELLFPIQLNPWQGGPPTTPARLRPVLPRTFLSRSPVSVETSSSRWRVFGKLSRCVPIASGSFSTAQQTENPARAAPRLSPPAPLNKSITFNLAQPRSSRWVTPARSATTRLHAYAPCTWRLTTVQDGWRHLGNDLASCSASQAATAIDGVASHRLAGYSPLGPPLRLVGPRIPLRSPAGQTGEAGNSPSGQTSCVLGDMRHASTTASVNRPGLSDRNL